MKNSESDPRARLIALFHHALRAVRADTLAENALGDENFSHVIALGKAGEALAAGAWRASLSSSFPRKRESSFLEAGFLAVPRGYATGELSPAAPFERHEGAHPIPDETSLAAGAALLRFTDGLAHGARVAVLVSGGASASLEYPAPGVDLALLQRANRWLIASGLPIEAVNRVRASLSQLKGGGLAHRLANFQTRAWILADVNVLEWVGGGLLSSLPAGALPGLPEWLRQHLVSSPPADFSGLSLRRLAGNEEAVAAVVAEGAREMGTLAGDATGLGQRIGSELAAIEPGLYVWGGETTVRLPDDPGKGGRCQQLALAAAWEIAGHGDCFLLAASTDGWDGSAPVAGACVNGGTIARGQAAGLDAQSALRNADAGRFLAASGDLVRTGPTGTHVNDLVIAVKGKG